MRRPVQSGWEKFSFRPAKRIFFLSDLSWLLFSVLGKGSTYKSEEKHRERSSPSSIVVTVTAELVSPSPSCVIDVTVTV